MISYREVENELIAARRCGGLIQSKTDQIKTLRSQAVSITQQYRKDAGASCTKDPHAKMDNYAIMIEDLVNHIQEMTRRKRRAMEMIELIEDYVYRDVMFDYYIGLMTWEEVSIKNKYEPDSRWVFRIKKKCIREIANRLNCTQ